MFICRTCVDDCEGAPIDWAKEKMKMGFGSLGPCEFCGKTDVCADVPSSAPWKRKEKNK